MFFCKDFSFLQSEREIYWHNHVIQWKKYIFMYLIVIFLWYEYPDLTATSVLHVRWGIDINVALNRQLHLTRLSVQLKLGIEHSLCGHMTLLISHTCTFIQLYNNHYIFWHSTVSGILSCKILLHVFRQFTGKFDFEMFSLRKRNSENCDEALGLVQKNG